MGTVSVPNSTLCLISGVANGIFVFWTERDWSRKSCYGNTIEGIILFLLWCTFMVPSFKNTALIFPEILFIQYFTIWPNLHNRKTSISLNRKKIFQKEKPHSSVFWKAFQISRRYFSCHMHFKTGFGVKATLLITKFGHSKLFLCFQMSCSNKWKLHSSTVRYV